MADRIWNFNPGPATLPLPALEKAKADIPNYAGTGMAVMELSHRSKEYAAILSVSLFPSLSLITDQDCPGEVYCRYPSSFLPFEVNE